jgi:hypothetical protein
MEDMMDLLEVDLHSANAVELHKLALEFRLDENLLVCEASGDTKKALRVFMRKSYGAKLSGRGGTVRGPMREASEEVRGALIREQKDQCARAGVLPPERAVVRLPSGGRSPRLSYSSGEVTRRLPALVAMGPIAARIADHFRVAVADCPGRRLTVYSSMFVDVYFDGLVDGLAGREPPQDPRAAASDVECLRFADSVFGSPFVRVLAGWIAAHGWAGIIRLKSSWAYIRRVRATRDPDYARKKTNEWERLGVDAFHARYSAKIGSVLGAAPRLPGMGTEHVAGAAPSTDAAPSVLADADE